MAIIRYFGLPGAGKTTIASKLVVDALKSGDYKNVYGNIHMNIPGYTYIPFDVVGKYQLEDCFVVIDEAAIECGNRDYKSFPKEKIALLMTHRHYRMTLVFFSQEPDGVDTKIRAITDQMYYLKKGAILGRWISTVYKIPYGIVWPSENSNGENLGKIVMGYMKPPLLTRLFAQRVYRPRYYKYFDSWEAEMLPALPKTYQPIIEDEYAKTIAYRWYKTTRDFTRKQKKRIRRDRREGRKILCR